jgi:hypothetical protein
MNVVNTRGYVLAPSTLAPRHLFGTCSAPRDPVGTFDAFQYGHLRHLQHLQPLFHYLKCFSQHLAVKIKGQSLETKFYRKVLRKALKIMEKRLQVLKVPRCRAGAEVPGCWVPALTPLGKYI